MHVCISRMLGGGSGHWVRAQWHTFPAGCGPPVGVGGGGVPGALCPSSGAGEPHTKAAGGVGRGGEG